MKKSRMLDDVASTRHAIGANQLEFWSKFGVSQSGGSRYESGRNMPLPLKVLLWLFDTGRISDKDLADAQRGLSNKK